MPVFMKTGVGSLICAIALLPSLSMGSDRLGFGEPKILKLDWNTRSLNVYDLDGDNLQDLVVINNDTAQIELLYQINESEGRSDQKTRLDRDRWEPVLEDALFDKEKITIGFPVFDLGVGDLNDDGLPDLVYTAREAPMTVRYQSESGTWVKAAEFDGFDALGWQSTLKVTDVDGDGRNEVVLLASDAVRIFTQNDVGSLEEPDVFFLTGENPFNLEVRDVTGDGLKDICYISTEGKQSLVVREQLSEGGFAAERSFILDRSIRMYDTITSKEGREQFVSVDSRSGALEVFELKRSEAELDAHLLEAVQPASYPVFQEVKEGARYAFGDLEGDGNVDIQIANPSDSELIVFSSDGNSFTASKRFPTFSAISSLSSGRFFHTSAEAVVCLSVEEKTLGISRLEDGGRVSFPRLLKIWEGDPLVCEAVDLDGDGYDELAVVYEYEGKMQLILAKPSQRKKYDSTWEFVSQMELEGVKRKPTAIRQLSVFDNGSSGLMLFIPREAPILVAPSAEAELTLEFFGSQSSIRESLLKGISPSEISEFDVDGDGLNELIAARTGYARAIRIDGDELAMVDQFNARRSDDEIAAVIPIFEGKSISGLVMYVPKEGELQFLQRDEDGVVRYRKTEKVGAVELIGWKQLSQKKEDAYLLYGVDRFWHFAPGSNSWELNTLSSFETEIEDIYFSYVSADDFNADGYADFVAVDGSENVVEILAGGSDGHESQIFWEIFEQNMHYQGRTGGKIEPRETVIADLNGDGLMDFAFLIHDRIIIYPQE